MEELFNKLQNGSRAESMLARDTLLMMTGKEGRFYINEIFNDRWSND